MYYNMNLLYIKTINNKYIYLRYKKGSLSYYNLKLFIHYQLNYRYNNIDDINFYTISIIDNMLLNLEHNKNKEKSLLSNLVIDTLSGTKSILTICPSIKWINISHKFNKCLDTYIIIKYLHKELELTLDINNITIFELKIAIEHHLLISFYYYELKFNSIILDDFKSLNYYQITNKSIIELFLIDQINETKINNKIYNLDNYNYQEVAL